MMLHQTKLQQLLLPIGICCFLCGSLQAQTVSNMYLAAGNGLEILPVGAVGGQVGPGGILRCSFAIEQRIEIDVEKICLDDPDIRSDLGWKRRGKVAVDLHGDDSRDPRRQGVPSTKGSL